ncbi:hypothetical protein SAMN05216249_104107 [Acetitomaculum ruminis DSM 5522]|uniref:FlgN protein n=1 Tax=Acetitomaculum ruminis DSM 5522 TaxID=1120918 RepID=A0A1I0WJP4_9FIRM|nr:hypothetical protein [Acetitomaculum ruminis]SFA88607.1 hypothetical protein SAMN05216249_104107 [Acetitomaculum ruminis DSM 5522]
MAGDVKTYLNILIDSSKKKINVLNSIIDMEEKQKKIFKTDLFDEDALSENLKEKENLIAELNILDAGFEDVYDIIKDEVTTNPQNYADSIGELKQLIKDIVGKIVEVRALEGENKTKAEEHFSKMRTRVKKSRMSKNVASHYYKSASKLKNVDSQFIDKWK